MANQLQYSIILFFWCFSDFLSYFSIQKLIIFDDRSNFIEENGTLYLAEVLLNRSLKTLLADFLAIFVVFIHIDP